MEASGSVPSQTYCGYDMRAEMSSAKQSRARVSAHLKTDCEQRWNLVLRQVFFLHNELQRRKQLRENHQHVAQRRVSGDRQLT